MIRTCNLAAVIPVRAFNVYGSFRRFLRELLQRFSACEVADSGFQVRGLCPGREGRGLHVQCPFLVLWWPYNRQRRCSPPPAGGEFAARRRKLRGRVTILRYSVAAWWTSNGGIIHSGRIATVLKNRKAKRNLRAFLLRTAASASSSTHNNKQACECVCVRLPRARGGRHQCSQTGGKIPRV